MHQGKQHHSTACNVIRHSWQIAQIQLHVKVGQNTANIWSKRKIGLTSTSYPYIRLTTSLMVHIWGWVFFYSRNYLDYTWGKINGRKMQRCSRVKVDALGSQLTLANKYPSHQRINHETHFRTLWQTTLANIYLISGWCFDCFFV